MLMQIDMLLAGESPNLLKLSQLKLSLQEKLDTLKLLDSEILGLIDEGELTSEIEQADAFKEGIYTAMIKIDKCVSRAYIKTFVNFTIHYVSSIHYVSALKSLLSINTLILL